MLPLINILAFPYLQCSNLQVIKFMLNYHPKIITLINNSILVKRIVSDLFIISIHLTVSCQFRVLGTMTLENYS